MLPRPGEQGTIVKRQYAVMLGMAGGIVAAALSAVSAEEDFPIAGTYLQDQTCKGDGSDPAAARVTITRERIESSYGLCSILEQTRDGNTIAAHISCPSGNGQPIMGDVTFTLRDDKTIAFVDQDNVYSAVLHKCPE
jgi:hypothetical protein